MGGVFQNIVDAFSPGGIRGQQHQRFEEGLQQQQQDRANQDADQAFHKHMLDMGARPVVNGAVHNDLTLPDGRVIEGGLLEKADPARFIPTGKDKTVGWQSPTEDEAGARHIHQQMLDATNPEAVNTAQITSQRASDAEQSLNRAGALGTAQGRTQGAVQDLDTRGTVLPDDQAAQYGVPKGTRVTPEQLVQLTEKYNPVRGAQTRADVSAQNAQLRAETQKSIADAHDQAVADHQTEQLQHQDMWNRVRGDIAKQKESGLNSRNANRVTADQKLHGQWTDQAFKEEQAQIAAQALLEEHEEPGFMGMGTNKVQATPDNQQFVNPFTGKTATMNYGQRLALKNGLDLSQRRSGDLRSRIDDISERYGLDKYTQAPAPRGTAPTTTTAPTTGVQPPPQQPQQQQQPPPTANVGAKVRVKTGDGKIGFIPRANLARAKQLDPKLAELP